MENKIDIDFHNLVINEETLPIIEQIADGMPGGFFIYHADGDEEMIYVNRAMLKIFGCETLDQFKKLTGYTFKGMVHPEDLDRAEAEIAAQIKENSDNLDYVEYRITRADGDVRWIMDYGHFVHTDNLGDIYYVFISDSTDMRLEIQENRRQADVIMGLATDYETIMLLDLERYAMVPYAFNSDEVEFKTDTIVGKEELVQRFKEFANKYVVEEDRALFLDALDIARIEREMHRGDHLTINYRIKNSKGDIHWIRLSMADVEDDFDYSRVVLGFKNVTQMMQDLEKETEERIRIENDLNEALHANQAKSTFLFNMSHDVRTPLNAIVGFSTLARKYLNEPARVAECLDSVDEASDHLVNLLDDVLYMSQIESGSISINNAPCSVFHELDSVVDILSAAIAERNLNFEKIYNAPQQKVEADSLNLRRIFMKVLDNAVKFTRPAGTVRLIVNGTPGENGMVDYEFRVEDTGIGMSSDFQKHIFEAFEREGNTTQIGHYGTGLGLSITKALVEMMNGTIEVQSEKNVGTIFTIKLSFKAAEPDVNILEMVENALEGDSSVQLQGKRVLVVEDNELNRLITETILTDVGLLVDTVTDGADAVNTIRHQPPGHYDMVLMDIQMPIMNGYDATRAIRAIDREDVRTLPIIALSANSMEDDKRRSIESGMNAHIAKPIDVSHLISTLKEYVNSAQQNS